MGRLFPPQNCPFPWGTWTPPSNAWFPGPIRVLSPNGISIGAAVLQGSLVSQTGRQADRPRYTVGNKVRIYIRSTAMRPNNGYKTVKRLLNSTLWNRLLVASLRRCPLLRFQPSRSAIDHPYSYPSTRCSRNFIQALRCDLASYRPIFRSNEDDKRYSRFCNKRKGSVVTMTIEIFNSDRKILPLSPQLCTKRIQFHLSRR